MRKAISIFDTYRRRPAAVAVIRGNAAYPHLGGTVMFYPAGNATLVKAQIWGLPRNGAEIFGFHIHQGSSCSEPFSKSAGGHFNPGGKSHPFHSGDMPPLFGCDGTAYSVFLTNRFTPEEIIGRTVIIHLNPDDFTTQPSGNSGEMIACGVVRR